ncbi:serine/threonine-protein kinase VRK3 isoform X1 [Nerophis lumbriciformis]|uniref:serine/threonine-protein kinase VRK3 isoform X1 n=1 Tax=Nerophis lumbriciformis TaxID=546530 RepID=UPI002ADF6CB8|nr:inactive serine/threonine-protein kinase VRK3-like isoform X1 [Nerophis lumbriciformis]
MKEVLERMTFRFCPQCGTKLQCGFKFCPSCGEKIPCATDAEDIVTTISSPPKVDDSSSSYESAEVHGFLSSSTVSPRPALRTTRKSRHLDRKRKLNVKESPPHVTQGDSAECPTTSPEQNSVKRGVKQARTVGSPSSRSVRRKATLVQTAAEGEKGTNEATKTAQESTTDVSALAISSPGSSPNSKSLSKVRRKARLVQTAAEGEKGTNEATKTAQESTMDVSAPTISSPGSSPTSKSLSKGREHGKAKKTKNTPALEPLEDGMEVTDTTGRKWTLQRLLSQSKTELMYEVVQKGPAPNESTYVLKMGAKDGRIFNEQNFLQRAAKPLSVSKWAKQHSMDLLGIPSYVGFGFHADTYRFLIFSTIGQPLQSIMKDNKLLTEKNVLHLTCRILDALHYIHSNEYVHGDVNAENIYIQAGHSTQVYLVGYCQAFRYCPSGQHVEYREGRRALPESSLELISLDCHKGVAPSRRSDLQSLGYCMLRWHTGALPWGALVEPDKVAALKHRYMDDVPALMSHCFGWKRISNAFQSYLTAVSALQYTEQPDYSELKTLLSASLSQLGGSLNEPLVF